MIEGRSVAATSLRFLGWLAAALLFAAAFGGVAGLVVAVPALARTVAEREQRPRLTVSDVASARPGTLACLEGRVAAAPGGVVAHEHWERSNDRGGTRLVSASRPVIWLEQDGRRAALRASTYVLERIGPSERAFFGTVEEILQVRSGDVVAAYGMTTGERQDGAPVFEAQVVSLGQADAGLTAHRESLRSMRLFGWASVVALAPMLGAWLLSRRRRRAAASATP